jgi:hypothetical protein
MTRAFEIILHKSIKLPTDVNVDDNANSMEDLTQLYKVDLGSSAYNPSM